MVFKVEWKSGATSYLSGTNWQDAMEKACIQNEKGWIKKVVRDRSREEVELYSDGHIILRISEKMTKYWKENIDLRAENAELKHALEIIRSHGRG